MFTDQLSTKSTNPLRTYIYSRSIAMIPDLQRDQAQAQQLQTDSSDDDIQEVEAVSNGFYDKIYGMAEKFAGTRIGQFVIERCDHLLRSIEETAKWSLPKDTLRVKLVRPFNWLIFLMLIVALRLIRVTLSIGALLIGNRPVTAHDMVYFLQTRRRKLRAIRLDGLKQIQRREEVANVLRFSGTGCFTSRISALLSIAICQPGQYCLPGGHVFAHHGYVRNERGQQKDETDQNNIERQPAVDHRDDIADNNLTFDQMLSKYADVDSEDDPDFVPQPEEEDEEESSEESTSSSDSSTNKNTAEEKEDEQAETNRSLGTDRNAPPLKTMPSAKKGPKESSELPRETNLNRSLLDQSVELRTSNDNHHHHHSMPKPIPFLVKREPLSDIDSGSEQTTKDRHIPENQQAASRSHEQEEKTQEAPQKDNVSSSELMTNDNDLSPPVLDNGLAEKSVKTKPHLPGLGTTAVAGSTTKNIKL